LGDKLSVIVDFALLGFRERGEFAGLYLRKEILNPPLQLQAHFHEMFFILECFLAG
jgi:hypothetical protein